MKCPTCHEEYATRAGYEAHVPNCAYKDNPLPEPEKEEVKGPSYNELKERAKELGIEGFSKMKKEELAAAIEEAEAAQKAAELEEQQKAERLAALRIQAEELGIEGFAERILNQHAGKVIETLSDSEVIEDADVGRSNSVLRDPSGQNSLDGSGRGDSNSTASNRRSGNKQSAVKANNHRRTQKQSDI